MVVRWGCHRSRGCSLRSVFGWEGRRGGLWWAGDRRAGAGLLWLVERTCWGFCRRDQGRWVVEVLLVKLIAMGRICLVYR